MSDPTSQLVSDKELELDDSKCRQIVSDGLHSLSDLSNSPSKHVDEELMLVANEHTKISDQLQGFSDPLPMHPDEELGLFDEEKRQIVSDQIQGFSHPLEPPSKPLHVPHSFSDLSNPPSKNVNEELMLIDEEHQIVSDPPSMQLDEKLMLVDDECQIVSDHLDGLTEDLKLTSNHVHILSDSSEPSLQPRDKELELDDSKCQQIISDVLHSNPPSKHVDEELMLIDEEHQIVSDPLSMQLDEKLMLVDDKCQIVSDQLDGLSEDLELTSDHVHILSDSSEPSLQPRDKELELDDSKCQQIISDVLHSNPPSKHVDEELMLIDEEHQIVSDPLSMQLDEKLMLVDDKCQIVSDQLDGLSEDLELTSDHVHILSDSSEPSLQPRDKELELDDSKCLLIVSDVLHSNPPSKHFHEEVMLIDEEHQVVSDPPLVQLDEKLMLVDEKCQIVSDHLDVLPEDRKLTSDHVHILSDSSEPSLQPRDEVETTLEVGYHPLVEKEYQLKEEEAIQKITSDSPGQEKLTLNFNDNIVDQVTKIMSDPSDLPSKNLDESKTIFDQLHVLSGPSESSLQSAEELVCIDEELMDFPPVKEVLNLDEVELAPESTKEPVEVDNLEYCTFSLTNPRFSVILSHSQANYKYNLTLPGIMANVLPQKKVPVILSSYGKIWTMFYNGHLRTKTFNASDWKKFVVDNELKVGDCCFFELLENSPTKIVFKVVILKTDSSPSCDEEADVGESSENPILVD